MMRKWGAIALLLVSTACGGSIKDSVGVQVRPGGGDDCAGILPGPLPESRSIVTPHQEEEVCGYVTVDQAGNIAGEASRVGWPEVRWRVVNRDGFDLGSFTAQPDLMPQPSGFQGIWWDCPSPCLGNFVASHSQWDPDGSRRNDVAVAGELSTPYMERVQWGGSQVLTIFSDFFGRLRLTLRRFDADGNLVRANVIGYPAPFAVGGVDLNGFTLIVFLDGSPFGFSSDDYVGRWYDDSLNAISDYFVITAAIGMPRIRPSLRPLIGGGILVQLQGNWVAMSPSGAARAMPAPDWLVPYSNYDIEIVRGGRAHALIPKWPVSDRSTIPLYSASGNHCGEVTLPLPNVTVGMDGTVISLTGEDACTVTWWPQVLP